MCTYDKKSISFAHNGLKSLKSHSASAIHKKAAAAAADTRAITSFMSTSSASTATPFDNNHASTKAELIWGLHVAEQNYKSVSYTHLTLPTIYSV